MTEQEQFTSAAAAGRYLGRSRNTISRLIADGTLPPLPLSKDDLDSIRDVLLESGHVGATSPHGSMSRWAYGCRCEECTAAKSRESDEYIRQRREEFWAGKEAPLIEKLMVSSEYQQILGEVGVTWQAIRERQRVDKQFSEAVESALMSGRPSLHQHGTATSYRTGCRCTECADWKRAHR